MEDSQGTKEELRQQAVAAVGRLTKSERAAKTRAVEERLFDFANFLEAHIVMMYLPGEGEIDTRAMIASAFKYNKIVVLPVFDPEGKEARLFKVDNLKADLRNGPRGGGEPDPGRCKQVPLDVVDIAIVPAIALDEKGGRIGTGAGDYDRLIPLLAITTRKVALAFEEQILPQIPMESHDKFVDIIISDQRIIYKI